MIGCSCRTGEKVERVVVRGAGCAMFGALKAVRPALGGQAVCRVECVRLTRSSSTSAAEGMAAISVFIVVAALV